MGAEVLRQSTRGSWDRRLGNRRRIHFASRIRHAYGPWRHAPRSPLESSAARHSRSRDTTMNVGDVITWQRTFTEEDIRQFGKLSGDEGAHHIRPDEQGRLMVQGLLTATLPTKIGGDLSFIARKMTFQFLRPVYADDTIECQVTIIDVLERTGLIHVSCKWICRNQHGKEVMTGQAKGIIRQ